MELQRISEPATGCMWRLWLCPLLAPPGQRLSSAHLPALTCSLASPPPSPLASLFWPVLSVVPVQILGGTSLIDQTVIIPFGQSPYARLPPGDLGRLWMEHCWVKTLLLIWSGTIRKTAPRRFPQQEATGGAFSTRRIHWTVFQNQYPRLPASCPVPPSLLYV